MAKRCQNSYFASRQLTASADFVAEGRTNKEIARMLFVSEATVKFRFNATIRLILQNRVQLAVWYVKATLCLYQSRDEADQAGFTNVKGIPQRPRRASVRDRISVALPWVGRVSIC